VDHALVTDNGGNEGMKRRAYGIRRLQRHLILGVVSAAILVIFWATLAEHGVMHRLSMGSAYAGLVLLCGSLALGPINVIRDRPNPVSFDLRRDVGIWAGIIALFHVVVGLQAHLGGRFWLYFVHRLPSRPDPFPIRLDLFGLSNHTGLAATLILAALLALSNDRALRRLGAGRWKTLQRWNYAAFGLVALHGAGYQLNAGRGALLVALFAGMVVAVIGVQFVGYRKRTTAARGPGARSSS
jgi:methionine sulfoxide reductase heme-binding subunit